MNNYVTGSIIKRLRENCNLTQAQLAEKLFVSDKAVSKWETGRGFPDISMLENLARVLNVSVIELLSGEEIVNRNKCGNVGRGKFYVCPVCGNVIFSVGDAVISCCGIVLPALEAEAGDGEDRSVCNTSNEFLTNNRAVCNISNGAADGLQSVIVKHQISVEKVEDEYFVSMNHEMSKEHFVSFFAVLRDDGVEIKKLYPEQNAEARFKICGAKRIFGYCNRHGLFVVKV